MQQYFICYMRETPAAYRYKHGNAVVEKHPFEWLIAVNKDNLLPYVLVTWREITPEEADLFLKAKYYEENQKMYHAPLPKTAKKGRKLCSGCKSRDYSKKYPHKRAWYDLRKNAKRRGIPCTITFEEFLEFCIETDYITGKGRTRLCLSIDRKREFDDDGNIMGYTRDNIQALKVGENSTKFHLTKHLRYDYRYPELTRVVTFRPAEGVQDDNWF